MIAKPPGVGPLSPPQPVNPSTDILEKITAQKICTDYICVLHEDRFLLADIAASGSAGPL